MIFITFVVAVHMHAKWLKSRRSIDVRVGHDNYVYTVVDLVHPSDLVPSYTTLTQGVLDVFKQIECCI